MKRILLISIIILQVGFTCLASDIVGIIKDNNSNELLVGASIYIKELKIGTSSGLDGSYRIKNIPQGTYTIVCNYISYNAEEKSVSLPNDNSKMNIDYSLSPAVVEISQVTVSAHKDQSTELSARSSERMSANLLNVVSAKTIELSPDQDMASVVQRMSGVTLDKSSSSGGQYALLRGMDKRYSYTLVNGIQIPSTNNKQRYVSLDIFPAALVDRTEVTKALTPDMEGDAIAGAVNIVMKNAPEKFLFQLNVSEGYNAIWNENKYLTFDVSAINSKSPYELRGSKYSAIPSDFTRKNLDLHEQKLPLNTNAEISIGNRFFTRKLGWILASSYNNSFKGTKSLIFNGDQSPLGDNLFEISSMNHLFTYDNQQKYGIHNKFDFSITPNHTIQLYTAYLYVKLIQVRDQKSTTLGYNYDPANGTIEGSYSDRNRLNIQNLLNTTLQGNHNIANRFSIQWSAVYSNANNQSPDNSSISYDNSYSKFVLQPQDIDFGGSTRQWLHNSDISKAGYLNLKYKFEIFNSKIELKTGGLYRDTKRSSFANIYTLIPHGHGNLGLNSTKGIEWNNYSEINWTIVQPLGTINNPGTFNAYETVKALYGMFTYEIGKLQFIGGVRYEETKQGYDQLFHSALLDKFKPGNDQKRDHKNKYFLPSLNGRYAINDHNNIKVSYYKAINKPGFLEIVPYLDNTGEYAIKGNPELRNSMADNYDLRYEYFPNQQDQLLTGVFYKKITDAIEEGFTKDVHGSYALMPLNSNAYNYGLEVDVIKFFREYGIKANYTWTHSRTSSFKRSQENIGTSHDTTISVLQYRPLYGQSENVGNISLLYKGAHNGFNAQLAMSYTGDRIYRTSPDINADWWQRGFWQLDLSAEKKLKFGLGIFIKARNLLNTHVYVFLKQTSPKNESIKSLDYGITNKNTMVRDEYSGASYLIGIRYKFN